MWRINQNETANGFSSGEEDSRDPPDRICCLVDDVGRCQRLTGNASYSKKIKKIVTQRRLSLREDESAGHTYICDHHKTIIQSARTKKKKKDSEEDSNEGDEVAPLIDFNLLSASTLRRYKRHFKLSNKQNFSKPQLVEMANKHFKTLQINEKDVISGFYQTVKTNGNKMDLKNGGDSF